MNIEGYTTKPCKVKLIQPTILNIILTEGKKHQVRRMLAAVGYTTLKLKRIRIANIRISGLTSNKFRPIEGKELDEFLKRIKLK